MALLDLIVGPVMDIVNKLIPDPAQKAQAQLALLQLQQNEEFKQIDAQLQSAAQQTDTNKVEASSANLFVSGWRPFIGWICGTGLGWNFAGLPVVQFFATLFGHPVSVQPADLSEMMPLLIGMLGLGGMRTYEKINGVNSGH